MHERRVHAKGGGEAAGSRGCAKTNTGSIFRPRPFFGQHQDSGETIVGIAFEGSSYSSSHSERDGYSCLRPLVYYM